MLNTRLGCLLLLGVILLGCTVQAQVPTFTIKNQLVNPVSNLLFGQMMERAAPGEPGPEAALIPGTHDLQSEALRLLNNMQFPLIRFPGGGVVESQDWTTLIDNAPGRPATRATGFLFGYDEYLRLAEQLKCETILPVNLRDGIWKSTTLDAAALQAAGLVAYCNAPLGAKLPAGMPDWPAIRAKNGHPAPYHVNYFQVGNDIFAYYSPQTMDKIAHIQDPEEQLQWCLTSIRKYIEVMRQVDPSIKIIVDGVSWSPENFKVVERILADSYIKAHADFVSHHLYLPHNTRTVQKNGVDVAMTDLTSEELWNAGVSTPFMDKDGQAVLQGNPLPGRNIPELAEKYHWKIAMTEWNWNGWANNDTANSLFMKGIGVAGFLHAIIRDGGQIDLATQSMLIGKAWDFDSIHVDPTGKEPAYPHPCGQMTAFYAKYHGNKNLFVEAQHIPTYVQPIRLTEIGPKEKVAVLDAIATASDNKLYFHVINRDFTKDHQVVITLADFPVAGHVIQHCFEGTLKNEPPKLAWITDTTLAVKDNTISVTLPMRSVSILEIDLAK